MSGGVRLFAIRCSQFAIRCSLFVVRKYSGLGRTIFAASRIPNLRNTKYPLGASRSVLYLTDGQMLSHWIRHRLTY